MAVDTPYDFHLRNKHEFYRSLMDGIELENAAANYIFSKMNAERHNVFTQSSDELAFDYTANQILKGKWKESKRESDFERFGLSDEPWIQRLTQFTDGHNDPRSAHSAWPSMADVDPTQAYGSVSPWDLSALTANSQWGSPEWLNALSDVWEPQGDDHDPHHHHDWIEKEVHEHEGHHQKSFHNTPGYLGKLSGDNPSDLYEKHFARWKAEVADPKVLDMSLFDQKQAHLDQYKRVWSGKERDPLADIHDNGSHQLGFLGYALGLEWMTPSQRDDILSHISTHGTDDSREKPTVPHMPVGWLNRNWAGRFLAGEAIQRMRDPSYAGSMLTGPHYGFESEDVKEHHNARRLSESMKDVLVYDHDNEAMGYNKGDPVVGNWGAEGWEHDEHGDPMYDLGTRSKKEQGLDPRLLGGRDKRHIGASTLMEYLLGSGKYNRKVSVKVPGKGQQSMEYNVLPRYQRKNDFGRVDDKNFQFKNYHDATQRAVDKHNSSPVWDRELEMWKETGVLDENHITAMLQRRRDLHEEYDRRKQVSNAVTPFTNLYHYANGDAGDVRLSPMARFIMMHHAQGGLGGDSANAYSELHHMTHPDIWGGPDGDGLFTQGDANTPMMSAMKLEEGQDPQDYPPEIWPAEPGRDDDWRETPMRHSIKDETGRDNTMSLIGPIQQQPPDKSKGLGALWNLPHGGNRDHNLQLMTTADPHFHESLRDGTGPMRVGRQDEDEARRGLRHSADPTGRLNMKKRALLASLWGRWNENPAEAQLPTMQNPMATQGAKLGQEHNTLNRFESDLRNLAQQGMHLIPGHPGQTDLEQRIQDFLIHSDFGRQTSMDTPMALDKPASESFQEGLDKPTLSRIGGQGRWQPSSFGFGPGEKESDEQEGWLDSDTERGKWYLYDREKGMEHKKTSRRGVTTTAPVYHQVSINVGNGKTQPYKPSFDFKDQAHQALENGKMGCPVCGGDGHIDPEDMGQYIQKAGFIGLGAGEESDERPQCPNCHGSGTMQLPSNINNDSALVNPHPDEWKERTLTNELEDWLATDPEHRDPEKDDAWFEDIENQIDGLQKPQAYGSEGGAPRMMEQFGYKMASTMELVRNVATSMADKVRSQFESDGLPDPFGPDENGDWSQGHVNALALWSHANEWALRAQPKHRDWENDQIAGYGPTTQGGEEQTAFLDHQNSNKPTAGAAIYYPQFSSEGGGVQTDLRSVPLSIYNSMGHRMRHGWGMTPTFGVSFDNMGEPTILHNGGKTSTQREKYLNVPLDQLQSVFPEMQPMSAAHPSAPSANDRPESQKLNEFGQSMAFQMSEDEPAVSDILKALTNPDLLKDDVQLKPVKAAHRIFDIDDLKQLRGFSDDWVVTTWVKGHRAIARKEGDKISAQYADGSYCSLSEEGKEGLKGAHDDDFVLDVIIGKNKNITVIDLLEHDGRELYEEPLKERLTKLRSSFESTDAVHMPAPFNTRRTDDEGLIQAINSLAEDDNDGFLLRDAISTYMKGEPRHPKWVLLRKQKEIDVIILDRRGRGPYTYQLGVGPINPDKGKALGNRAVERDGKWFMDVGTLTREEKTFNEGDYVQVNVSSVSHRERDGEDVYDIQTRSIIGETSTEATDSVDTLNLLTKSYAPLLWPHDVIVNTNDVQVLLHGVQDTVIYKMTQWPNGWALHEPMSLLGDLSNSDYSIHLSESLRPFWEPIVGMTIKGLIKVDYNPRDTKDKTRDEKEEDEERAHESGFKLPKPKRIDDDQILKPEMTKMVIDALTLIDGIITKEKATWTGARGMGIGLGTPDSAPRGPTEITQDVNTLDYDMRQRDDERTDKPRKKPAKMQGEPHPMTASVTTDEGEKAKIRVTDEEATLEIQPENPFE